MAGNRKCAISSRSIDQLFRSIRSEGPLWYLVHRMFGRVKLSVLRIVLPGSRLAYRMLVQSAEKQVAEKRKWEM